MAPYRYESHEELVENQKLRWHNVSGRYVPISESESWNHMEDTVSMFYDQDDFHSSFTWRPLEILPGAVTDEELEKAARIHRQVCELFFTRWEDMKNELLRKWGSRMDCWRDYDFSGKEPHMITWAYAIFNKIDSDAEGEFSFYVSGMAAMTDRSLDSTKWCQEMVADDFPANPNFPRLFGEMLKRRLMQEVEDTIIWNTCCIKLSDSTR